MLSLLVKRIGVNCRMGVDDYLDVGDGLEERRLLLEENQELATSVFAKDDLVDEINAEATQVLAEYIQSHPESALFCLHLASVFRKLERAGDHIKNMAEEIVFFIDAKVLKHSGKTDEYYSQGKQ